MENTDAVARRAVLSLMPVALVDDNAEEVLTLLKQARKLSISKVALAGFRSESGLDLLQMAVAFDAPRCVEILIKSLIFPIFEAKPKPKAAEVLDTLLRLGADHKADRAVRVLLREGQALQDIEQRTVWAKALGAVMADLIFTPSQHLRIEAIAEDLPRALAVSMLNALEPEQRDTLPLLQARATSAACGALAKAAVKSEGR